jgi:hypothetical protein
MLALHDVVQAGYARYIGMSSCWAWQCQYLLIFYFVQLIIMYLVVHAMQSNHSLFCISHCLKHCTRLRDQQPPHAFHLDAESLQPNIPQGRARDALNSQGLFPCLAVLYLLYSLVWLISHFPIYAAFRCRFHPVVSAWQRLVDPPDRREDQTW